MYSFTVENERGGLPRRERRPGWQQGLRNRHRGAPQRWRKPSQEEAREKRPLRIEILTAKATRTKATCPC